MKAGVSGRSASQPGFYGTGKAAPAALMDRRRPLSKQRSRDSQAVLSPVLTKVGCSQHDLAPALGADAKLLRHFTGKRP